MDTLTRKHLGIWLVAGLAVLNVLTLAALWFVVLRKPAPEAPPREGQPRPDVSRFLNQELGLTPEQSARMEALRRGHAADFLAVQEEIHRLKKAEMDEFLAASPDPARSTALAEAVGAKESEKETLLYTHLRSLMDICDPGQKERFRSILGELLKMMGPPGQAGAADKPGDRKGPGRGNDPPSDGRPPERDDQRPPRQKR
jgi:hypothetical protein